ncbi:MAG: PPK2 family polyphosphate kinase [Bacteroidota bacterium]|nr:PPK2 family polyphosphate kinase [Bacteroidota bacterium]
MFDKNYLAPQPNSVIKLNEFSTDYTGEYEKKTAKKALKKNTKSLKKIQKKFYADNRFSLLIILQAPDAAGKDGTIRHVMGGINPQGCRVHSFKKPSTKELEHDYLWRHYKALPERGMIEIFNRSHYENVLVSKVHPQIVLNENIPHIDTLDKVNDAFWETRYNEINTFEKHLANSGTHILKFFLNLSKEEQKTRFKSRLYESEKNWKFSPNDLKARKDWKKYVKAYEDMLSNTNTGYAPWFVIPADKKWFSRIAVGTIIHDYMSALDLKFPKGIGKDAIEKAKLALDNE